jgi:hypothetical protein
MRNWRLPDEVWQIVAPVSYRMDIMRLAHDIPMARHLGINKTCATCRILIHIYWPRLRIQNSEVNNV